MDRSPGGNSTFHASSAVARALAAIGYAVVSQSFTRSSSDMGVKGSIYRYRHATFLVFEYMFPKTACTILDICCLRRCKTSDTDGRGDQNAQGMTIDRLHLHLDAVDELGILAEPRFIRDEA